MKRFRAWFNNEMHDEIVLVDPEFIKDQGSIGCPLNSGIKDFLSHNDPDTPMYLMEYFDLPDKNGMQICEDDVVKYTDDDGSTIIGIVEMFRYQWGLMNKDGFHPFTYQIQTSRTDCHEILGDIHRNPELKDLL